MPFNSAAASSGGPPGADAPPPSRASPGGRAAAVFVLTLALALTAAAARRPLRTMGGFVAPYYGLTLHLAKHATHGRDGQPSVFKPPGYAAFGAAVLRSCAGEPERSSPAEAERDPDWTGLAPPWQPAYLERGARALHAAQCVALAGAAALLCLWCARLAPPAIAFALSLAFGSNAYSLVYAGVIHYTVLHWLLLAAGGLSLARAFEAREGGARAWLASGLVWGAATLVRPVSLLLPPLVLLALLARTRPVRVRPALRDFAAFALGMALALGPWTLRNFALTGRLVPVNAQAWAVLFSATARRAPAQPDHFRYKVAREEQIAVQARVAGHDEDRGWEPYDVAANLALEDAYRAAALQRLRAAPGVYLFNAGQSLRTLALDLNAVVVDLFVRRQQPGAAWPRWYWPGTPQRRLRSDAGRAVLTWAWTLTGAAALALLPGLGSFDRRLLPVLAVAAAVLGAHVVTWMDSMYYYVKLPFLVLLAAYALGRLEGAPGARGSRARRAAAQALALAITALALASTALAFVAAR